MRRFVRLVPLLALLAATPARGQDPGAESAVLAGLAGVSVVVEPLSQDLVERGITADGIAAHVRLRLRESGVNVIDTEAGDPVPGSPTLYIQLIAILTPGQERCTYSVRLDLMQTARLERDPNLPLVQVPTWGVSGLSRHGRGWRKAIIDDILAHTDAFVSAISAADSKSE